MVDKERVVRLLGRVRSDTDFLRRFAGRPPDELIEDETTNAAIKYRFVTLIEGAARIAHHVSTSEGWTAPDTNADAFRELGRRGVLSGRLARALADAAGFRNVLVHQYADVDDRLVMSNLARLDDFLEFDRQVVAWLDSQPAS